MNRDGYEPIPTTLRSEDDEYYEQPKVSLCRRWRAGEFTIVPEGNRLTEVWDGIMMVALLLLQIELPFEVLIGQLPYSLDLFKNFIDTVFIIDIILNFNIAYTITDEYSVESYERTPFKITRHYLAVPFSDGFKAGWFWPDLLSVIPFHTFTTADVRWLKAVRMLRLVRMFRMVRVIKVWNRLHTRFGFSLALVRICKTMAIVFCVVHWLACLWAHVGVHHDEYTDIDNDNWLSQTYLANHKKTEEFTLLESYTLALYFCTVVLTTVGFGDLRPMNMVEVVLMIFTIFITALTWAWVVANVVEVISHMDVFATEFKQNMDDMTALMNSRNVNRELQFRIRKHLHEAYNVHQSSHHRKTITWLSPGLQGELAIESGMEYVCSCIWYFQDVESCTGWLIDLAHQFDNFMYSPNEYIMDRFRVYVIRKGCCSRRGRIILRDAVIGDDMILMSEILKDTVCPRAITLTEVMGLSRDDLAEVCQRHADLNLRIRRAQIRLAVRRAFVYIARRIANNKSRVCKTSTQKSRVTQTPSRKQRMSVYRAKRRFSFGTSDMFDIQTDQEKLEEEDALKESFLFFDPKMHRGWVENAQSRGNDVADEVKKLGKVVEGLEEQILATQRNFVDLEDRLTPKVASQNQSRSKWPACWSSPAEPE